MPNRILIIDDEPDICTLLAGVLKSSGNETYFAHNLEDGKTQFETKHPEIVFLDLNLPDGSGFTLLPEIKQQAPDTKVVICSAYDGPAEREQAKQKGADMFIGKPFNLQNIKTAIQSLYA